MSDETAPKKRPAGLGRGLSALLGEMQVEAPVGPRATSIGSGGAAIETKSMPQGLQMVDIGGLRAMPNQPRKVFDDASLDELAESIASRGLLQPIVVREARGDGHYEIIAGERRWRAAQKAQLHQVPVIIKEFDDQTAFELAIIENIQREQLNAWEEGNGYARLIEEYGYTQDQLAKIVGKSRPHIANLIRLQGLPISIHNWMSGGALSMGHARALLTSTDPEALARQVINKGLSVRQTEALVKKSRSGKASAPQKARVQDADTASLEQHLSNVLGLKVSINHGGRGGSLSLHYSSLDQLDMLCQRLTGEKI